MSSFATPQPSTFSRISSGFSTGTKFFVLCALALVMSIPGLFVSSLASDRAAIRHISTAENAEAHAATQQTVMGIRMADSYRSTQRSLKYITLFLGLVFLTYFIFEVTTSKRVHPGQYVLVGVAQTVFYLLLLSLAEHLGFDLAFLIAGAATVILFAVNTDWLFRSRKLALRAFAIFTLLYGFIYVLLRLEDYALLVGAIASFIAVAATMYFTRSVDWYSHAPAAATATAGVRESWLE